MRHDVLRFDSFPIRRNERVEAFRAGKINEELSSVLYIPPVPLWFVRRPYPSYRKGYEQRINIIGLRTTLLYLIARL